MAEPFFVRVVIVYSLSTRLLYFVNGSYCQNTIIYFG
jgi:hypothetical protein